MKKFLMIFVSIFILTILVIGFYFGRFSYISFEEIDIAIQQHHFQQDIKSEKKHFDLNQQGFYKEIQYKDEPHYIYTYQTVNRPTLKDLVNPQYQYKKANVETFVENRKNGHDITHMNKAKHEIHDHP
ncbi:DUF3139 domain-containing protein [Staphylococcus auricularis]|uniref:DUF3139 domain-containing protein n=1 Tax=Staphylococcus auricularis TaxID=29379 RepID=UPI00242B62DA|nr:DUF3139 domain-containing protein [Staphylococcus auricularis]